MSRETPAACGHSAQNAADAASSRAGRAGWKAGGPSEPAVIGGAGFQPGGAELSRCC